MKNHLIVCLLGKLGVERDNSRAFFLMSSSFFASQDITMLFLNYYLIKAQLFVISESTECK